MVTHEKRLVPCGVGVATYGVAVTLVGGHKRFIEIGFVHHAQIDDTEIEPQEIHSTRQKPFIV